MLKRRKESGAYLATDGRYCWSLKMTSKNSGSHGAKGSVINTMQPDIGSLSSKWRKCCKKKKKQWTGLHRMGPYCNSLYLEIIPDVEEEVFEWVLLKWSEEWGGHWQKNSSKTEDMEMGDVGVKGSDIYSHNDDFGREWIIIRNWFLSLRGHP